MKNILKVLSVISVILITQMQGGAAEEIAWEEIGKGNLNFESILVDPRNPNIIFAGTDKGIIKTEDGGKAWRSILSIKGTNTEVNLMVLDENNNSLYAATGNGLYFSNNQGENWKRIFKGKDYLENQCKSLAVLADRLYLGTKEGLLVSNDKGSTWIKQIGALGKTEILNIAYNLKQSDHIYVACVEGVFKSEDFGQTWRKIFLATSTEKSQDNSDEIEDNEVDIRVSEIRYISVDPNDFNYVYLVTSRGIYASNNQGEDWQIMPDLGLLSHDVNFLLVSKKSEIFTNTGSGIFEYKDERWHEISLRLISGNINFLAIDNRDNLYVAADKGLFKADKQHSTDTKGITSIYQHNEPGIREVQKAAVRYAEVGPEKIKKWRQQASKKAWFPEVTLSADRNVTDLWHWEGGSTTRADDDFLRRGDDAIEWGIDISWNFGELIWNQNQNIPI